MTLLSKYNIVFSYTSKSSRIGEPVISLRRVSKRFPGVVALDNISLDIYSGEILALLGENGAGKSTLIKILYGIYTLDKGDILFRGQKIIINSPRDAIRLGIIMVPQTPQLIDTLSVAENLALSLRRYGLLARISRIEEHVRRVSKDIGIEIDPSKPVSSLSYTQKQLVEIIRAFMLGARILLVDEATTLLPLEEKKRFYNLFRDFVRNGGSVVLITHKIHEAVDVADRIVVLRSGRIVSIVEKDKARLEDIRKMMFGERITIDNTTRAMISRGTADRDRVVLEVVDLWVTSRFNDYAVRGIDLTVREGEVVGVVGITGNGQEELVQAIVGLTKPSRGRIRILGVDVTGKGTSATRRLGLGYISDAPTIYGVSLDNTIEENIAVLLVGSRKIIRWREVREIASKLIKEYNVKTPDTKTPVKILSGGNLMKVLVSRELAMAKSLLVAHNPTRALDEVSANYVRNVIREKALKEGVGVLLVSEDLDEVLELSDRVLVINSGRIVGEFQVDRVERRRIEELMVM